MKVKNKKYSNDEELFRIIVINFLIVFSIIFLSLLYNKKAEEIYNISKELLDNEKLQEPLRLIGISISSFRETENRQITFF